MYCRYVEGLWNFQIHMVIWMPPLLTILGKSGFLLTPHFPLFSRICVVTFLFLHHILGPLSRTLICYASAFRRTWWRHQMARISALQALCAGNSPVTGEFPTQRPVTRSFDVLFDLDLNKQLSKQSWGWWSETPSCPLWRHCNAGSIMFKGAQLVGHF